MAHLCGARLCQDNLMSTVSESVAKVKVKVKFHMASVKGKSHVKSVFGPPPETAFTYMYRYMYTYMYDGSGNRRELRRDSTCNLRIYYVYSSKKCIAGSYMCRYVFNTFSYMYGLYTYLFFMRFQY